MFLLDFFDNPLCWKIVILCFFWGACSVPLSGFYLPGTISCKFSGTVTTSEFMRDDCLTQFHKSDEYDFLWIYVHMQILLMVQGFILSLLSSFKDKIKNSFNTNENPTWFGLKIIGADILYCIVCWIQIIVWNWFFGIEFFTVTRDDMKTIFPVKFDCPIEKNVQCILGHNTWNIQTFLVLWHFQCVLMASSVLTLISRFLSTFSITYRIILGVKLIGRPSVRKELRKAARLGFFLWFCLDKLSNGMSDDQILDLLQKLKKSEETPIQPQIPEEENARNPEDW